MLLLVEHHQHQIIQLLINSASSTPKIQPRLAKPIPYLYNPRDSIKTSQNPSQSIIDQLENLHFIMVAYTSTLVAVLAGLSSVYAVTLVSPSI